MTRSNKYSCIRKCELPPRFYIAIYFPSLAPKQCAKFHRFSNCIAIFKLMSFAKRSWWSQILLHGKLLVQRARFPTRISGMDNMKICSSLLMLTFWRWKDLKQRKEITIIYIYFKCWKYKFLLFLLYFYVTHKITK